MSIARYLTALYLMAIGLAFLPYPGHAQQGP